MWYPYGPLMATPGHVARSHPVHLRPATVDVLIKYGLRIEPLSREDPL